MKLFLEKWIKKFYYALCGLKVGVLGDASIRLQVMIASFVGFFCIFLKLNFLEWLLVISVSLLVIVVEFINTCIEIIVDQLFTSYNETAKKIKDLSAAAVLITSFIAICVAIYIISIRFF